MKLYSNHATNGDDSDDYAKRDKKNYEIKIKRAADSDNNFDNFLSRSVHIWSACVLF